MTGSSTGIFDPRPGQARLRVLGAVDLRDPDDREVAAVVRQPKRLALLAYLVLAGRGRWMRRDTILALFWPELDTDHARAALRRALHFLRREMGAELVPGRGEEEIGIAEGALWCDVIAFEAALRSGEHDRALRLYTGDLLTGFFVAGAPEVERWLDGERERLRREAARAAWSLAGRHPDHAVEYAERAVALAPDDEDGVRRLMLALEQSGDLPRAVRAYQSFTDRLRADLGIGPTDVTSRLAARLRLSVARDASASGLAAALPSAPGMSRPLLVAVCPFGVEGPERLHYVGDAMMQLLGATLDGAGPVQTVEPNALRAAIRRAGVETPDPAIGRRIARHFGAGCFVVGSVVEAGGRLRAVAALYDDRGEARWRVEASAPSEDALFTLADGLSRGLLEYLGAIAKTPLAGSAARTTASLDALKAYLAGEHTLRAGRYAEAAQSFQQATVADPEFALAHHRLAGALAGLALIEEARSADFRAHGHRVRLSDHDRRLVESQHAWLSGAAAEAEAGYAALVATYPESLEGWFRLGDVLFHSNPDRGRSVVEAQLAFERATRLDPEHIGSLTHLARIHALEGRGSGVSALAERILALSPSADHGFAVRALRAFTARQEAEQRQLFDELTLARGFAILNAFVDVAVYARNLEGAEQLARRAITVARSDEFRALCHLGLGCVLLAQNRSVDADAELREVTGLTPAWGVQARAVLACLPGEVPGEGALIELASELEAVPSPGVAATPGPLHLLERVRPHVWEYLRSLTALRLGRRADAAERFEGLSELDVPGGAEAEVEHLLRVLEAELQLAAGRENDALRALERPPRGIWYQVATWSPVFAGTHQRLLRARLLAMRGDLRRASSWLTTLAQRSPFELMGLGAAERLKASY